MPIKELLNGTRLVWFLNLYKSDVYQKKHSCRPIHGTQHAPWIFDCITVGCLSKKAFMQADTWNSTRTMNLRLYLCSKKWVDFDNCHGWLTRWYAKSSWEGRVCDRRLLFCLSLLVFWIALKLWGSLCSSFYCCKYSRHSLSGVAVYLCTLTTKPWICSSQATTTTTTMGLGLVATAPVVTEGPQSEVRQFFGGSGEHQKPRK